MKNLSALRFIRAAICLALAVLLLASVAWANPTTPEQAKNVVLNWLGKDAVPLGAPLGRQFKEVQTFTDSAGAPAYYVVYLNPAGMVFLPADDLVEPIIGFLPEGLYDPSPTNPLGALVSQDIPGRVLQARQVEAQGLEALAPESPHAVAQRKWAWLLSPAPGLDASEFGINPISDVRVASFVSSRWNQAGADGSLPNPNCNYPCYNYFTPPYAAGNAGNYVSGCVATAMSQLIRFWSYPTSGIGVHANTYYISGTAHSGNTRGGDDSGGAYVWGNMPYTTSSATTDAQRAAIGRLLWDAGLSVNMNYDTVAAGGSGTDTLMAADAFLNTFQYSNAKKGYNSGNNLPDSNRNNMVNPNLHAGYPALFGITGNGGHAIVCDGYGYNGGTTMYHHLNMGWSGYNDAWYNLPTIDTSDGTWTSVYKCIYNVYPSGTGEIIAGRVTTSGGSPISGATVTANRTGGGTYTATTGAKGIYALAKVPSASSFTVRATKTGYAFTTQVVNTGTSTNMTTTTGNVWGVDFAGIHRSGAVPAVQELLLLN